MIDDALSWDVRSDVTGMAEGPEWFGYARQPKREMIKAYGERSKAVTHDHQKWPRAVLGRVRCCDDIPGYHRIITLGVASGVVWHGPLQSSRMTGSRRNCQCFCHSRQRPRSDYDTVVLKNSL